MTVLSKSKIKVKDGKRLYFNKFGYKVHLKSKELYHTYWVKDLSQFRQKIDELVQEQSESEFYDSYRRKIDPNEIDYETVENYLNFRNKYKNDRNLVIFRREGDGIGIYVNEVKIIDEVLNFSPNAKVTQIIPMPTGVLLFKQTPPAAYRIYCKTSTQPGSIRDEIIEYLGRTPDMVPNIVLKRELSHRWAKVYFHAGQYFDYNDNNNILIMHLLFPGILGKSYKLEKK